MNAPAAPGRVLVAMSGGVDSSVAAALLIKQGYECVGATMKLLDEKRFPSDAADEARKVCEKLGIKHYVFDFSEQFEREVIRRFAEAYERGVTPNPCIECNRRLKFGALLEQAEKLGCGYIATGHYARTEYDEAARRTLLKKALNAAKDQSYVLYTLSREQLSHTLFPLGTFPDKESVRAAAAELDLISADRKDSQDICFVPDGDYAGFIAGFTGKEYPHGAFIDKSGNVLGEHKGMIRYTIGQRKGLGLSFGQPMYVAGKNPSDNTVVLAPEEGLYSQAITASDFNWISLSEPPREPIRVTVRTRYHAKEAAASVSSGRNGLVTIVFDEPQRAVAAGQAVVLYDRDTVVGGGTIA